MHRCRSSGQQLWTLDKFDVITVLQNTYPEKIKSWRHVVYTCYQPRSMATIHDLELKAQAWHNYQITTHLPAENIRVYDENFAKRKRSPCHGCLLAGRQQGLLRSSFQQPLLGFFVKTG